MPITSPPGNPRPQPHDKDVYSATSWAGWASDWADTCFCGPQKSSQSLNSQPERPELHHHPLAASVPLRQVTHWCSHRHFLPLKTWQWRGWELALLCAENECFWYLLSAVAGLSTVSSTTGEKLVAKDTGWSLQVNSCLHKEKEMFSQDKTCKV